MVVLMDSYSVSEGLFVKNYLGTISAVPKSRTASHMGTKSTYAYAQHPHPKGNHSVENGTLDHARISVELNLNNEGETKKPPRNEIDVRNGIKSLEVMKIIHTEKEEEKEKKKEKKWTLGGFFRKKNKKDADDTSDNSDEEHKKGFLSRRKPKQDRRKFKSNTNGFDVVVTQQKENSKNGEISVEQLWSGDSKTADLNSVPVRFINRHPDSCQTTNTLQIPKHCRRDSNLSKSSGGSENTEGKKSRKEVMARAEAKRDMLRDDSSSEEYESYHSSSSLNRQNVDCRRPRRTDRHKRLSKDEDLRNDLRMIKSDFEGSRRLPPNCSWTANTNCPDSSDLDAPKSNWLSHSGTPSPCRSPRTRQKHHNMIVEKLYPTSTFPPGAHSQQMRNRTLGLSSPRFNYNKENRPLMRSGSQDYRDNWISEYGLPNPVRSSEKSHRKTLMDYEELINSGGSAKEKSLSCYQNIHRASCFESASRVSKVNEQMNSIRTVRCEPLTKGGIKANIHSSNPRISENSYHEVVENRNESVPSLTSGIFPQKPTQIVRRSASGNSFLENSRNSHFELSDLHNPNVHGYCSREEPPQPKPLKHNLHCNLPSSSEFLSQKSFLKGAPSVLRYYADQNPRSRNPIHITCYPAVSEQPYLSDSQMIVKPGQLVRTSASDFWKLKDKEMVKQIKKPENFLKLPPTQSNPRVVRSRSISPKLKELMKPSSNLSGNPVNENESKSNEIYKRKSLKEEYNEVKLNRSPPEPPVRRLSRQEVLTRLQKCEQLKIQENESKNCLKNEAKVHSSNLDEALIELEMIYNSLKLRDEDLACRVDGGNLPVFRADNSVISLSVEENSCAGSAYSNKPDYVNPTGHQRVTPLRGSSIPDKKADDMAYRRMNQKDRAEVKKLPPQSYLRSSPALSPAQKISPTFRKESPVLEPDITYDDVMFRNIRHANSTLKIQDPQPPFGIPIGVITPAPNSDYLHVTPIDRFRPTFTSSKMPDVVKDDLAFRNLRKDSKANTVLEPHKNELKKRAVRSLSANLCNIMQKDNSGFVPAEPNTFIFFDKNCEKTQSLTDLTKGKLLLEKRLKELKEEKNAKRTEFFELSQEARKNLSWKDLSNLCGSFEDITSNRVLQKSGFLPDIGSKIRLPVVELSKYPAAAPSYSLLGNPFKEAPSVDDDQLESLLSALVKEAEDASKDLGRQLDRLETKQASDQKGDVSAAGEISKARAIEEFDKKFRVAHKTKRRRNLSLSNTNEPKEVFRNTGSLERRKANAKSEFVFAELLRGRMKENKSGTTKTCLAESKTESKLQKSNSSFEVISDLSEILRDVEVETQPYNKIDPKETNNVFQEVYEYNCKPSPAKKRSSQQDEENVETVKETPRMSDAISDVETEFEKLHQEVNSTNETKEAEFASVDDLMADITSVDQSQSDSYSSFPFPNDSEAPSSSGILKPKKGTSLRSIKGEGEVKKASLDNNVWLSCSYAFAFAFYLQEIDFLTALGIVLAVISIVAILIL